MVVTDDILSTTGRVMDRANIDKRLPWLNPSQLRRAQGRRIKVYVPQLDMNFRLVNPPGGRCP
jgi:hypothetical protein